MCVVITALKKHNALVSAVITRTTTKKNLNPPILCCVRTDTESVSSSRFWPPLASRSAGIVTATLGGPSKSFKKAYQSASN